MNALSVIADAPGGASTMWLGVGLGLRHAADADHVVAVTTLVERERNPWRAAGVAALWGLGHTASFLMLGALVVLGGVRFPAAFDRFVDAMVGAMLIGLGTWQLLRAEANGARPTKLDATRSVAVGLVHGLAGSTAIALLATTTIGPVPQALLYLGEVALGTVLGMVGLTVALTRSVRWAARDARECIVRLSVIAAFASVGLGVASLAGALHESLAAP